MNIKLTYEVSKDADNFIKTLSAVNNREHTRFQKLFIEKFGSDFKEESVRQFIQESTKNIDIPSKLLEVKESWAAIQDAFIKRVESIFKISYPKDLITIYLTTNQRCGYNIEQDYFFVYLESKNANLIIMHELFHFYTWYAFYGKFSRQGVSKSDYNDIKESLTELLNIEFSDLMNGSMDKGYPQHQEMRVRIKDLWLEDKNIDNVMSKLVKS